MQTSTTHHPQRLEILAILRPYQVHLCDQAETCTDRKTKYFDTVTAARAYFEQIKLCLFEIAESQNENDWPHNDIKIVLELRHLTHIQTTDVAKLTDAILAGPNQVAICWNDFMELNAKRLQTSTVCSEFYEFIRYDHYETFLGLNALESSEMIELPLNGFN